MATNSIRFTLRLAAAAAAMVVGTAGFAQNNGVARVTNAAWGYYYADTTLQIDIGGTSLPPFSQSEYFIADYKSNFGTSANAAPAPVAMSHSAAGNTLTSPAAVTIDSRAGTTWGANHVYTSISGFDPVNTTSVTTLCQTLPGTGTCVPGFPEQTQTLTTNNWAYSYATSRWEEIYQTGGGAGTLSTTFGIHLANLGGQPSSSGTPNGNSSFSWAERDFGGNAVVGFQANYYADSDTWGASTFSNATGTYVSHYFTGTGALTVGGSSGVVLTSSDGTTFDGTLTANRSFATGDVVYVDSYAQTYVSGNGIADAEGTVTLLNLHVPTGIRVLAQSGTNYGGVLSGGGGLCTTTSCLGGGGGGGGPTPVPEPETYAMLLSGLLVLGWLARRRGRG